MKANQSSESTTNRTEIDRRFWAFFNVSGKESFPLSELWESQLLTWSCKRPLLFLTLAMHTSSDTSLHYITQIEIVVKMCRQSHTKLIHFYTVAWWWLLTSHTSSWAFAIRFVMRKESRRLRRRTKRKQLPIPLTLSQRLSNTYGKPQVICFSAVCPKLWSSFQMQWTKSTST